MSRPRTAPAPEVHRAQGATWAALVLIPVGIAGLLFLDTDVNPIAHGLLAVLAALELMIALRWWRGRRTPR